MSSACRSRFAWLLLASFAVACSPSQPATETAAARELRVCADPNSLPFSNERGEGLENRLAALLGDHLQATVTYVWWAQRRGFIRNTLQAGMCDVVMGLPADIETAATTQPYYRSSYVFVTREGEPAPRSFDDPMLGAATIGVHLIGDDFSNSPPAHALTARGHLANVRGYSVYGDYRIPNPPARLIEAVASGALDVAVAWGPLAGYFAKSSPVPLHLTVVSPEVDPPFPFVFDIAMGVARGNPALRAELNQFIDSKRPAIDRILHAYGVPRVEPAAARSR
jgi:mxaJ protein